MIAQEIASPRMLEAPRSLRQRLFSAPPIAEKPPLLLVSNDERFWRRLLSAAIQAGRWLFRDHLKADGQEVIQISRPSLVLLDLDLPRGAAWDIADSLLRDKQCLLLVLLTSRSGEDSFKTAIQAGSVMDKSTDAARLMEIIDQQLESSDTAKSEQNAMLQMVIRWLKPYNWSAQPVPLRRFWGINE